MIPVNPKSLATLRVALAGRRAKWLLRESLPANTMAYAESELPWVRVSPDVFEELRSSLPREFTRSVLRQLAEVMDR